MYSICTLCSGYPIWGTKAKCSTCMHGGSHGCGSDDIGPSRRKLGSACGHACLPSPTLRSRAPPCRPHACHSYTRRYCAPSSLPARVRARRVACRSAAAMAPPSSLSRLLRRLLRPSTCLRIPPPSPTPLLANNPAIALRPLPLRPRHHHRRRRLPRRQQASPMLAPTPAPAPVPAPAKTPSPSHPLPSAKMAHYPPLLP